jgi:hypothetical protein
MAENKITPLSSQNAIGLFHYEYFLHVCNIPTYHLNTSSLAWIINAGARRLPVGTVKAQSFFHRLRCTFATPKLLNYELYSAIYFYTTFKQFNSKFSI